jgi:hypothetical protein
MQSKMALVVPLVSADIAFNSTTDCSMIALSFERDVELYVPAQASLALAVPRPAGKSCG